MPRASRGDEVRTQRASHEPCSRARNARSCASPRPARSTSQCCRARTVVPRRSPSSMRCSTAAVAQRGSRARLLTAPSSALARAVSGPSPPSERSTRAVRRNSSQTGVESSSTARAGRIRPRRSERRQLSPRGSRRRPCRSATQARESPGSALAPRTPPTRPDPGPPPITREPAPGTTLSAHPSARQLAASRRTPATATPAPPLPRTVTPRSPRPPGRGAGACARGRGAP